MVVPIKTVFNKMLILFELDPKLEVSKGKPRDWLSSNKIIFDLASLRAWFCFHLVSSAP
jgi:hypothetical protein